MRSFAALVAKDLRGYLDQPAGYILAVIFVAATSYLFFRAALVTTEASLRPMFNVLPWTLALFVPAVTMRLVAEEERDGTLEILFTHPIRSWSVVAAKFVAGLAFVAAAIAATLGIPLMLGTAGNLDAGAVIAQYVGGLMLAAGLVATGLFASSLTRNQVVAFIMGLALNAVLMFAGLELVLVSLPPGAATVLQGLSPLTHFTSVARGVLALRDAVYFAAIVATFLAATYYMVRGKSLSHRSAMYHNLQVGVAGLVVVSLMAGWFGESIGGRWDLTESQRYTISPATRALVSGLDDLLTIRVFASEDLPAQVNLVNRDLNDFLDDLASGSEVVRVVRSDPEGDATARVWAQQAGVTPVEFSIVGEGEFQLKRGYHGLAMTYMDRQEAVPFIESVEALEYRLATLISRMARDEPKTVAILAGHGEKARDADLRALVSQLGQQYRVAEVEAAEDGSLDLAGVDVLVVAGPTRGVPEEERDAVAEHLDGGGSALVLVDSKVIAGYQGQWLAQDNDHGLAPLLARYGVGVLDRLVQDPRFNLAIPASSGPFPVTLPYPYWPRATVLDTRVAGEVESVALLWAAPLDAAPPPGGSLEVLPLLETSRFASLASGPVDVTPGSRAPSAAGEPGRHLLGAAIVGGAAAGQGAGEPGPGGNLRLVVVGDSDWVTDPIVNLAPENIVAALNMVDWLAQEDALAAIRSKVVSSRQLQFTSAAHRNLVQYGNIIGVPLLLVAIGIVRYIGRRNLTQRVYGREG